MRSLRKPSRSDSLQLGEESHIQVPSRLTLLLIIVFGVAFILFLGTYIVGEWQRYGSPLEQVLDIIMDSNESKLGADGKPIYADNGKFLKGPNYWKPESKIKLLLASCQAAA